MLDLVIRGGEVITPGGVGSWDIGVEGERIVAVAAPGTLPTESARVIDATGKIVAPGGVEPHAHLAHSIMSHPERARRRPWAPRRTREGMACGGTTTHIDFAYVRPARRHRSRSIERRAARWKGNSLRRLRLPRDAGGRAAASDLRPDPGGHPAGLPELQGLHDQRPAAASQACRQPDRLRPHPLRDGEGGGGRRPHGRPRRGRRPGPVQLRALPRGEAHGRRQPAPRPHQALRAARLPPHHRSGAGHGRRRLLRAHLRRGRASRRSPRRARQGLPIYGETLHQYACFNAEYYKTPRGFCSHTYPSLKFPEDQQALWDGLVHGGSRDAGHRRVPDDLEIKLRGKTIEDVTGGNVGAEARMGIAWSEGVVKRGMSLDALRRDHRDQCGAHLRALPDEGRDRAGQRRRHRPHRPHDPQDADASDDFHVTDYSPWEGWRGLRLAGADDPARQGHRRARQAARRHQRRPPPHPQDRRVHTPARGLLGIDRALCAVGGPASRLRGVAPGPRPSRTRRRRLRGHSARRSPAP